VHHHHRVIVPNGPRFALFDLGQWMLRSVLDWKAQLRARMVSSSQIDPHFGSAVASSVFERARVLRHCARARFVPLAFRHVCSGIPIGQASSIINVGLNGSAVVGVSE
jgi:hypothetical protein